MTAILQRTPNARRARGRRLGRTRGAVLAALVLGLLTSPGSVPAAVAHTELVSATPADRSTVASATRITLTFSDALRKPSVVVVTGPGGDRVDVGPTTISGPTATVPVRLSGGGRHTVAYRVVSADGHPVTGRTSFGFRPVAPPPSTSPTATASASVGSSAAAPSSDSPTVSTDPDSADPSPASASGPADPGPGVGVPAWATGAALLLAAGVLLLVRGRRGASRPDTGGRHR